MCDRPLGLWAPVGAAITKGCRVYLQAHLSLPFTRFGFVMPSFNEWKLSRKLNYTGHLIALLASVI